MDEMFDNTVVFENLFLEIYLIRMQRTQKLPIFVDDDWL